MYWGIYGKSFFLLTQADFIVVCTIEIPLVVDCCEGTRESTIFAIQGRVALTSSAVSHQTFVWAFLEESGLGMRTAIQIDINSTREAFIWSRCRGNRESQKSCEDWELHVLRWLRRMRWYDIAEDGALYTWFFHASVAGTYTTREQSWYSVWKKNH